MNTGHSSIVEQQFLPRKRGQARRALIRVSNRMPTPTNASKSLTLFGLLLSACLSIPAHAEFAPEAGEYSISGPLPGDQVAPHLAISRRGGYVVWEDNATDGDRAGISARRLLDNLSGWLAPFRVNEQGRGDQKNPQVALLPGGGAVFVWQSAESDADFIYVRFLRDDGTFATGDIPVTYATTGQLLNPAIAVLADGNLVVVWSDNGRDGDLQGVFGQRFTPAGAKLGESFRVNQFTSNNQRSPALAAVTGGGFVVAWISELQTGWHSVDVFARVFGADGQPSSDEFLVNTDTRICAQPALSVGADGGFLVAWAQFAGQSGAVTAPPTEGWNVFARPFLADGSAAGPAVQLNAYVENHQYQPRLSAIGDDHLAVWVSVGQDGSREGIYGRFLDRLGVPKGDEFLVNTTTISQQLYPVVAADGPNRLLVAWSSYVSGTSFDVLGQRYAAVELLPKPGAPHVAALSQSRLSVTWPELAGYDVEAYELFIDEAAEPVSVSEPMYVLSKLAPASTHVFRLRYRLADGRISAVSDPASGTTWDEDTNLDQLPDDWQAMYWGDDPARWPAASADSDGDGATNYMEFLHGTNPTDAASVLKMEIVSTTQGLRLNWNTRPGFVYQVQLSTNVNTWANFGSARFAPGTADSIAISAGPGAAYYRVIRIR